MDELPAIIHRLSLRLWCPEYRAKEDQEFAEAAGNHDREEAAIDPLASPPQDAVDARGNVLDANEISNLSLDGGTEIHSLFSQKNLLRLAALNDSHRTLSLFTPSIRDTVFRAWAGPTERGDNGSASHPMTPSFSRSHSSHGSTGTIYTFNDYGSESGSISSRPSLTSSHSVTTGLSLGAGRRSHAMRKKKTRVVNLRKPKSTDDTTSESGESMTTESTAAPSSEPAIPTSIPEEPEEDLITPPRSPNNKVRFRNSQDSIDLGDTPRKLKYGSTQTKPAEVSHPSISKTTQNALRDAMDVPIPSIELPPPQPDFRRQRPAYTRSTYLSEKNGNRANSNPPVFHSAYPETLSGTPAQTPGIAEQAWMMKLAGEIARRAHEQKLAEANGDSAADGFWMSREESPPPAYEQQQ